MCAGVDFLGKGMLDAAQLCEIAHDAGHLSPDAAGELP